MAEINDVPETEEETSYTAKDVIDWTGCSYRQLDYWISCGYVHAIGKDRPGAGATRRFEHLEVQVVDVGTSLVEAGLQPDLALKYARQVVDGQTVVLAEGLVRIALPWEV